MTFTKFGIKVAQLARGPFWL